MTSALAGDEVTAVAPLRVVAFGSGALAELASTIEAAKAGDPLAPVTVVVPSSHAGVTLRRRLAERGGLVNVQFVSLPQLAGVLAAPLLATELRAPLAPAVHLAAVRAALADDPGWLRGVSRNATTAQSLATTLGELRDLSTAALDELSALGPRGAEVVRLHRDVRDRCVGFADDRDVLTTAITAVRSGARSLAPLGHVVVHLPRQLGQLEVELVAALARRQLVTVLLGAPDPDRAGVSPDPSLAALLGRLEPAIQPAHHVTAAPDTAVRWQAGGDVGSPPPISIVRAPDPDEEMRHAVRRILGALADGVRADRIAVVARLADPYFALAHEHLSAAGIAHHGPSGLRLDQTIAGRTLLGGLHLLRDDLPRVDLLRWLRAAPLRQPDGWPLPVDSFERIAREAGIAGGRGQWGSRLADAVADIDRQLARLVSPDDSVDAVSPIDSVDAVSPIDSVDAVSPIDFVDAVSLIDSVDPTQPVREPPPDVPASPDRASGQRWKARRLARRAQHLATLTEVIEWLAAMDDELARLDDWRARAAWARSFLGELLGPVDEFRRQHPGIDERWLAGEVQAYERVLAVLDSLGALDEIHERGDAEAFRDVLQVGLEAPAPPVGRFGHGVFVGGVAEVVGADHDLVLVLGMAEGVYPPRGQDDPILPDRLRAELGGSVMAPRRSSRADELRDHEAAVASGAEVVLSFARTDTRAQRERLPSRWLLADAQRLLGRGTDRPLAADELDHLGDRPWWTDVPSFASTVERHPDQPAGAGHDLPLVDAGEATAAEMFRRRRLAAPRGHRSDGGGAVIEVPAHRPDLVRGLRAGVDRHLGRFGPYTGRVGPHPALVFDEHRVGSATQFETWATCPFRYFVRYVLDVRGLDERADSDDINALDRGSYMHKVLEDVVAESIADGVDVGRGPFSPAELDRLREVAHDVGEQFRAEGRTGRPLLWSLRSEQLLRRLELILRADLAHRHDRGVQPIAVELAFGTTPPAPEPGHEGEAEAAVPPVVVRLDGDRPLAFRGFVDRVDRSPAGDRLVVIDYKTGSDTGYEDLDPKRGRARDIVCRGRHLQLALYALAAQSRFGAVPVSAFFWFVEKPAGFRGGDIDEYALARLREVLGIVVDGIEGGQFPARPGDNGFFGFTNCSYCDFNRICPVSRGDLWEAVRRAPELTAYRNLAEGPYEPTP